MDLAVIGMHKISITLSNQVFAGSFEQPERGRLRNLSPLQSRRLLPGQRFNKLAAFILRLTCAYAIFLGAVMSGNRENDLSVQAKNRADMSPIPICLSFAESVFYPTRPSFYGFD
jgi:hypothetical protein